MATVSYKAVAIAQNLLMNLQFQFPLFSTANVTGELSAAWVLGTSASGYPYLAASDGTSTHPNVVLLVTSLLSVDTIWTDSLGNSAYPFTPSIIQVAYEQNAGTGETGAITANIGYLNVGAELKLFGTLAQTGVQIQLFHTANASASVANMLAVLGVTPLISGTGAPDLTFDEYQYPGVASM